MWSTYVCVFKGNRVCYILKQSLLEDTMLQFPPFMHTYYSHVPHGHYYMSVHKIVSLLVCLAMLKKPQWEMEM